MATGAERKADTSDHTGLVHDTELCAWWATPPCGRLGVAGRDLCHKHYMWARASGALPPAFKRYSSDAHTLDAADPSRQVGTCRICGPGVKLRRNGLAWQCSTLQQGRIRKHQTGWTQEQYEMAVISQSNRCAICGRPPDRRGVLEGDHCHATKATRQLLCGSCNNVLGYAHDEPEILIAAARYLTEVGGQDQH